MTSVFRPSLAFSAGLSQRIAPGQPKKTACSPTFEGTPHPVAIALQTAGHWQAHKNQIRFGNGETASSGESAFSKRVMNPAKAGEMEFLHNMHTSSPQIRRLYPKAEAIQQELGTPVLTLHHLLMGSIDQALEEIDNNMKEYFPNRPDIMIGQTEGGIAIRYMKLNADEERPPALEGIIEPGLYRKENGRDGHVTINMAMGFGMSQPERVPFKVFYDPTDLDHSKVIMLLKTARKRLEYEVKKNINTATEAAQQEQNSFLMSFFNKQFEEKGEKLYSAHLGRTFAQLTPEELRTASPLTKDLQKIFKEVHQEALDVASFSLNNPEKMLEKLDTLAIEGHMPRNVKTTIRNEISRMMSQSERDPELDMNRTWVERALSLPWVKTPAKPIDLDAAQAILDRDHYGMEKVKKQIMHYLAKMKQNPNAKPKYLLFVGPPGVGKTSITRAVAEVLGRNYTKISVDGITDEHEVKGHRKTYIGSMPGMISEAVKRSGAMNPVMVIDEVDKLGRAGDPKADAAKSALISVLDPEQNKDFTDLYYNFSYPLDDVFFILTANYEDQIPPALKDRVEVVRLDRYDDENKLEIANRHLVKQVLKDQGLTQDEIELPTETIDSIIKHYTREAGVRTLKRSLATVAEAVTWKRQSSPNPGEFPKVKVTPDMLETEEFLGPQLFEKPKSISGEFTGEVNGLCYTGYGGDTLPVQANASPGNDWRIANITGNLEKVMAETPKYVASHLRTLSQTLKLKDDFRKGADIDIHCPAAATPKDGPSAGVTITTAIVSEITGIKVRPDVAMTGEVDAKGRVLPIGGVKEKLDAAYRAGIKTVIIPHDNIKDLKDVPAAQKAALEIVPVKFVSEVLKKALQEDPFVSKTDPATRKVMGFGGGDRTPMALAPISA